MNSSLSVLGNNPLVGVANGFARERGYRRHAHSGRPTSTADTMHQHVPALFVCSDGCRHRIVEFLWSVTGSVNELELFMANKRRVKRHRDNVVVAGMALSVLPVSDGEPVYEFG